MNILLGVLQMYCCRCSGVDYMVYSYCGANPIMNIDLSGRKFTALLEPYITLLSGEALDAINDIDSTIKANSSKISDVKTSSKRRATLEKQNAKLYERKAQYQQVIDEIEVLRASSQEYEVSVSDKYNKSANVHTDMGGELRGGKSYNFSTKIFQIVIGCNTSNHAFCGILSHELKHAYQFETGTYSSGTTDNGFPFYDITDEVEAVERGHLFGQRLYDNIYKIYSKLQKDSKGVMNLEKLDKTSLQIFAIDNNCAFRWNGRTYPY